MFLRFGVCAALVLLEASAAPAELSFSRDVRPILSANCFKCHGPDEDERQADLRLDQAVDIDFEELLRRVTSTDPDEQMPPPDSNKTLSSQQVDKLREWVAAGAVYEPHWAFLPPRKSEIPEGSHPIDFLIDAKLSAANQSPAGRADPYTLVRRVYLDLIGLSPTVEEADAFAADPSETAYAQLVDRLLASPAYGERWARRWLDLARYADTNGYEKDRDRSIWPYRDWVIRALNDDMPFDRFTVEQLAGDMLPHPTPEQIVATGFHRNTMLNEEGGIDPLEFRFHAMTDRIATTGTTWLGLTLSCAQCHTHKFDPITHADYYGMMALLNNADEVDYLLHDEKSDKQRAENLAEAQRLTSGLPAKWPGGADALAAAFAEWLDAQRRQAVPWESLLPTQLEANVPYLVHEGEGVVYVGGDTSKHDVYRLVFAASERPIVALRLEALPDERLPGGGPGTTFYEGRKGDFFLREFQVAGASITEATGSHAENHYGDHPVSAKLASDGDVQTGWSIASRVGERHTAVFVLDQPVAAGEPVELEMRFGRHFASSLGKFRVSATSSSGATASPLSAALEQLLTQPPAAWSQAEVDALLTGFLMQADEMAEDVQRIRELQKTPSGQSTLVMRERPAAHLRSTFRHQRGEYTQPGEEASPQLPEALTADGAKLPSNRLEFARWLVSDDNPLTGRVVANRHWAAFFGTGIVETVDDFGMQGSPPSHPKLLDHLAIYLREQHWSIKSLHRHIVTSAAYQRSSHHADAAGDPRLLARFPRQRLDAEVIRDSALRAAGILNDEMFGPPVRPPQPEGIVEVAWGNVKWNADADANRYRRSIYTYLKRTAPFAMFLTFDAGSGESCLARRDRSNTPLQALTLMNDPMFVEIADKFGASLADSDGDVDERIEQAFRRVVTRPPTHGELETLRRFYEAHNHWPALCRALLSLDEAVMKN